jgi:DNA-directed RNA polymerase II subunit RPB3
MSQVRRQFQFRKGTAPGTVPTETVFKNFLQQSKYTIQFQLTPTDVTYVNTLRRVILTEVETVAFRSNILEDGTTTDIKITKNSSPMSNEMLAHRIGLLPIYIANPLEWDPESYQFSLSVSNDSPDPKDIVAADIRVLKNRGPTEDPLPVPSTEFFHLDNFSKETALLAVLKGRVGTQEPETLSFEARATVGIGRENAQFIPVSQCSYKYTLDNDSDRLKEHFEKWLSTYKKLSPPELESNPTKKQELEREFKTMEINRCYKVDERNEPNSFDFIVESVGVLDPIYVVARALQVIQDKCTFYSSLDAGDLPETVQVRPADARIKGFDFVFQNEDHTLGNLLQTFMEKHSMDSNEITFVGYKVPHPLKDEMVLRVAVEDGKELTARTAVMKAARGCAALFKKWSTDWEAIGGSAATMPSSSVRGALQNRSARSKAAF